MYKHLFTNNSFNNYFTVKNIYCLQRFTHTTEGYTQNDTLLTNFLNHSESYYVTVICVKAELQ